MKPLKTNNRKKIEEKGKNNIKILIRLFGGVKVVVQICNVIRNHFKL
jgi:hypothetical protein